VYRHDGRPRGMGILTAWVEGPLAPNVRRTEEERGVVRPPQRGVARLLDGMEADEHHGLAVNAISEVLRKTGWSLLNRKTFELGLNNLLRLSGCHRRSRSGRDQIGVSPPR
jgi:hypothetical protein